jgi:hypothetical protein
MRTVQAPHCDRPQPNFWPFICRSLERTDSSDASGGASTDTSCPLSLKLSTGPSFIARIIVFLGDLYLRFLLRQSRWPHPGNWDTGLGCRHLAMLHPLVSAYSDQTKHAISLDLE